MIPHIPVSDFNLALTLESSQAFRWRREADGWYAGVVGRRLIRVRQVGDRVEGNGDPHYFSLDRSLPEIVATFPPEPILEAAVRQYWGLRVLRQDPWETLVSFLISSNKQIVQIRQIVETLAQRFGEPLAESVYTFPEPAVLARATEGELRACRLGFRAPYVLVAARAVAEGRVDWDLLRRMELARAREALMVLPGVGRKIADCVLLFSCGHDAACPIDVWMQRAMQRLRPGVSLGPYAGWAQQYLFHVHAERVMGGGFKEMR